MKKLLLYIQLMRLHRPVGIILLLWPALWGLWLANQGLPPFNLLVIFILGVIITRTAGCVINDIADRHFDAHVERTSQRPLATRQISLTGALFCLGILALLALLLLLQLNRLSVILGIIAALLAGIYPYMKRYTYFPQCILGLAYSMSVPMAFAASNQVLSFKCWLLFIISVLWTIMYDTAYALTDYADDIKIGVKSTAVFFKQQSLNFIVALQVIFLVAWLLLAWMVKLKMIFLLSWLAGLLLFIYQVKLLKRNQPFAAFRNNQWLGLILWLGLFANYY